VVNEARNGVSPSVISARFHKTVAEIILETCRLIYRQSGPKTVALSGGVFQNRLLFNLTVDNLKKEGFRVLSHQMVPCNDGGISLGQAVIANHKNNGKE